MKKKPTSTKPVPKISKRKLTIQTSKVVNPLIINICKKNSIDSGISGLEHPPPSPS